MARTGTELVLLNDGRVGDVATRLGGTLVLPPLNVDDVKHHFGNVKGFPGISVLVDLIKHGVPVVTSATPTDPRKALQYGNHSSVQEHMPTVWAKLCEDVRRNRCLVFTREAAEKIVGLRVAPLGAVVTHKVRIINDCSFDPSTVRGEKGGLNRDTISEEVPPCLCGEALPPLLNVLTDLRIRFPNRRILLAKEDVTAAFRNVRVAPDQAQTFCYMVDDVLVADFRLTFGWAGSPGHWGVMSEAAAHSHQNTTVESAEILFEGKAMMSHVKIIEPWEAGRPRQVPPCVRVKSKDVPRGGPHEPFFATVYVDDFIMARVQADPTDQSALVASASLASDHIRLFEPGEAGATSILAPQKSTDWYTTVDLPGFTVNTHTLRVSVTEEKIDAISRTLEQDWPFTRKQASAQEVLSVAGKLWNLTYVVRAGRYFVWQLLALTGLHKSATTKERTRRVVDLGWEFHNDIAFWKWAIDQQLVRKGESLCAPIYDHIMRAPARRYYSDASFTAIGGFCPELKVYWRYALAEALTLEFKKQPVRKQAGSITINLLELIGMMLSAFVMQITENDRPEYAGDTVLLRGDNVSAVSWLNRCGGARDKRAALVMKIMGRLELTSGWSHKAKHIPGVLNVLEDGISRWQPDQIAEKLRSHVQEGDWRQVPLDQNSLEFLSTLHNQCFQRKE